MTSGPSAKELVASIRSLTVTLVAAGLVDDQEFAIVRDVPGSTFVTTPNAVTAEVLKGGSYAELYEKQALARVFNLVMVDRALIQLSYEFRTEKLVRHRLSFLPSPNLADFQGNPELYLREQLFAEVVGNQAMSVPLRMDFDVRQGVPGGDSHPPSHLTLGQYQHCRIPVSAPVTPHDFVSFVLSHFYEAPGMTPIELAAGQSTSFDRFEPGFSAMTHLSLPFARS